MNSKIPTKRSILYYSDCFFFAGCEKMLTVFFSSTRLLERYNISFGYKYSRAYAEGLSMNLESQVPMRMFKLLPEFIPPLPAGAGLVRRFLVKVANRILFWMRFPAFFFDVFIFFLYFRKNRPDILHLNNGGYPGARSVRAAAIAARLNHINRIVMVVNSTAFGYDSFGRWMDYPLDKLVSRSVSKFVTGSHPTAVRLKEVLNIPKEKVISIHNGVRLPSPTESAEETRHRLSIPKRKSIIFSVVALLIPRQGHLVIFEAVKLLREKRFPLFEEILVLVEGFGSMEGALREFIGKNDLQQTIFLVGRESHIGNIYNITDVSIQHTMLETDLPNVISESMGWGKPVIATNVAGIPEQVIHGETGFVCEPGDVNGLASAIEKLCLNKELRNSMGLSGIKRFNEHFAPDVAIDAYLSLYESL